MWKDLVVRHPGSGVGRAAADGDKEDAPLLGLRASILSR